MFLLQKGILGTFQNYFTGQLCVDYSKITLNTGKMFWQNYHITQISSKKD